MNYLWLVTFSFAAIAMFRLLSKIEERIKELYKRKHFSYNDLGDGVYAIIPAPSNGLYLDEIPNVRWAKYDERGNLLIKAEKLQTVEDIVVALNSY